MVSVYYAVEAQSGPAAATALWLNGVPLGGKAAGESGVQSLPMQADVVPGKNELVLIVGTAGIAPDARPGGTIQAPERLNARLALQADRATVKGEIVETTTEELDSVSWQPTAGEPVQLPHRLTINFVVDGLANAPLWSTAPTLDPAEVRSALVARTVELGALLGTGAVDRFVFAMALRYREAARAYPLGGGADARQAADLRELSMLAAAPGFKVLPIDQLGASCVGHASNRLVECRARDGKALLRAQVGDDSELIELPMMFSRVNGILEVVR